MALFMIGLGLWDERDITIKGLEAVKICRHIYLEDYTSKLSVKAQELEKLYGKKIILADREMVEKKAESILKSAIDSDAAFLVVGDVFSATTHIDLFLRAREKGIRIHVINNASILNAIGIVGLELYKYGKTTSMPYFEPSFRPGTPYDAINENKKAGLHTLVLLDIKKDKEKYMTINEAVGQFFELEAERKMGIFTHDTLILGCARIGSSSPDIKYGPAKKIMEHDFGDPLHCLIIPGKLHFMEEEMLKIWKC